MIIQRSLIFKVFLFAAKVKGGAPEKNPDVPHGLFL